MKAWPALTNYVRHTCSLPSIHKEALSKQKCGKHNDVPKFKIGDLVMIIFYGPITPRGYWGTIECCIFNGVSLGKYQSGGAHPLSRQRKAWCSHPAQGFYIVSQLAKLRLKPTVHIQSPKLMTCTLRVLCAIHSATPSWFLTRKSTWDTKYGQTLE